MTRPNAGQAIDAPRDQIGLRFSEAVAGWIVPDATP